jgi:cell division protease FtsH
MTPDNQSPPKKERKPTLRFRWMMILGVIVGGIALIYYLTTIDTAQNTTSVVSAVSLPQLVEAIKAGQVKNLRVQGDMLTALKTDGSRISTRKEAGISTIETLRLLGAPASVLTNLPLVVEEPTTPVNLFNVFAVLAVVILIMFWLFRGSRQSQASSSSGYNFNNMGRSNPRVISGGSEKDKKGKNTTSQPQVTFRDVAGAEHAKLELQEIIEFLKEPGKFARLGARVPRGVLMAGPPGTGKTLLAKAVAGEAEVPFFSISGSEFVEMFVGVGAARVRDLFKRAREQAPAVVFVDEIDAVGRHRGVSMGNGNDEREQTLNQILVEMDGFTTDTNVIVMASTNRPDILDPALLRPGRFDRKVILDRPDVQGREAILTVHTRGKPLAADISIANLAKLTPGFVGADLENLVNEAAILAARRNLSEIGWAEFQDAMERIIAGPERQGKILSDYERQVVAYHEAGHAVVMHHLEHSDPVHKVSIISRGMALGYTMPLPEGDKYLRSREAFEDEITGLLGGRAAEEIIFKRITTGAANDLERATKLARAMVTRFGFSEKLGLRTFGEEQGHPFLGGLGDIRDYSEEMAQVIDQEIRQILDAAYRRAKEIVSTRQRQMESLAQALLEQETIDRPAFEALMA